MPYVRTIPYEEAQGDLKNTYDKLVETRGSISNVQAVSSLRPHIIDTLAQHVRSVMFTDSGLTRAEREMIAAVVSAVNKCQY
ncbi:MAG: hypothetical protein BZY88_14710 [SAR202 cluster bacterium Io17-Chloro-G9]|nr:MAG: hypothetical protein BZY88_14710 [SAR202 cluster bacterium Io17-Chloro-G9]